MRVLLVHPEDSPLQGPWAGQHWNLIVDLGKSSVNTAELWQEHHKCRVFRSDSFRRGIEDAKAIRKMFGVAKGRLVDEEGIDWWDVTSLIIVPEAHLVLVVERIAREIRGVSEVWTTRPDWASDLLASLLHVQLSFFGNTRRSRLSKQLSHYATLLQRFRLSQIKEIALDKYDADYRWRSRIASINWDSSAPFVLVPSAYINVSRMAAAYAQLLPGQRFVFVTTRQSAKSLELPRNVEIRELAAYAGSDPPTEEKASILERWRNLLPELRQITQFNALAQAGVLDRFMPWFRDCLVARNAWRRVLDQESVDGVLCGDDSNVYTRLPVLLAARRGIPTVDFHHGALDGRYLLKDLRCDTYLAKNEMERDYLVRLCGLPEEKVMIGAPPRCEPVTIATTEQAGTSIIFFSEPYEAGGMRAKQVYRELIPPLLTLAKNSGRSLIVKLHPFESRSQREKLVREVLGPRHQEFVEVIDTPLTPELMSRAWFGITVESTTVIDCLQNGVHCFLCGWLSLSPYGYGEQYARFGVGELLQDVQQVAEIPLRLQDLRGHPKPALDLSRTIEAAVLHRVLTSRTPVGIRSVC